MLGDIHHYCPIVKDLIYNIFVHMVVKGLPSLHTQRRVLFFCLVVVGVTQVSATIVYQQCWKDGQVCVLKRVLKQCHFLPLIELIFVSFLKGWIGLVYHWYVMFCYLSFL